MVWINSFTDGFSHFLEKKCTKKKPLEYHLLLDVVSTKGQPVADIRKPKHYKTDVQALHQMNYLENSVN